MNKQYHFTRPLTKRFHLLQRSTQTTLNPLGHVKRAEKELGAVTSRESTQIYRFAKLYYIDVRLFPPSPRMDEGTPSGAGGGETSSPQFSGRQIGVVQSVSQIMGFLDWRGGHCKESQGFTLSNTWVFFQSSARQWVGRQKRNHQEALEDPGPAGDRRGWGQC